MNAIADIYLLFVGQHGHKMANFALPTIQLTTQFQRT
jgi:hypothetical protein